jgi:hypothetical protein
MWFGIIIGVVVLIFGGMWLLNLGVDNVSGLDRRLSDEEIRTGRPCKATVLSVTDTRNLVNENTVYEVKLRVEPTDGTAYDATVRDALNSVEAGRVGAGAAEFRCVIDADDASRVAVFWSD